MQKTTSIPCFEHEELCHIRLPRWSVDQSEKRSNKGNGCRVIFFIRAKFHICGFLGYCVSSTDGFTFCVVDGVRCGTRINANFDGDAFDGNCDI